MSIHYDQYAYHHDRLLNILQHILWSLLRVNLSPREIAARLGCSRDQVLAAYNRL